MKEVTIRSQGHWLNGRTGVIVGARSGGYDVSADGHPYVAWFAPQELEVTQ